jgi:phytanoyl-CoA hydroxylase
VHDATIENGCLWGVPGSHFTPTTKFFRRNAEGTSTVTTDSESKQKLYSEEGAVCIEAKRGTVVLLHGDFSHFSRDNVSGKNRHAYTMHFVETNNVHWDKLNWLQRNNDFPFYNYYEHIKS